jgi:hypothetical protein
MQLSQCTHSNRALPAEYSYRAIIPPPPPYFVSYHVPLKYVPIRQEVRPMLVRNLQHDMVLRLHEQHPCVFSLQVAPPRIMRLLRRQPCCR